MLWVATLGPDSDSTPTSISHNAHVLYKLSSYCHNTECWTTSRKSNATGLE